LIIFLISVTVVFKIHHCPHRHHLDPQHLDYAGKSGHHWLVSTLVYIRRERAFARSWLRFVFSALISFVSMNRNAASADKCSITYADTLQPSTSRLAELGQQYNVVQSPHL